MTLPVLCGWCAAVVACAASLGLVVAARLHAEWRPRDAGPALVRYVRRRLGMDRPARLVAWPQSRARVRAPESPPGRQREESTTARAALNVTAGPAVGLVVAYDPDNRPAGRERKQHQ